MLKIQRRQRFIPRTETIDFKALNRAHETIDQLKESIEKTGHEVLTTVGLTGSGEDKQAAEKALNSTFVDSVRNENMWSKYGDIWSDNCKRNKKHIAEAINSYWPERLQHHSHIICCAGPGLDAVLPYLKIIKKEGTAVIWALDQSYKALRMAGIVPHVVVSVDFDPIIAKMLRAFPSVLHPLCIFSANSHPDAVNAWRGKRQFVVTEGSDKELCKVVPEVRALPVIKGFGTVSGTATWIARVVRGAHAKHIAIVGNDLSYPEIDGTEERVGTVIRYCRNTIKANHTGNKECSTCGGQCNFAFGDCTHDPSQELEGGEGRMWRTSIKHIAQTPTGEGSFTRYLWRSKLMDFYANKFFEMFRAEPINAKAENREPVKYYNCTHSILDLYSAKNAELRPDLASPMVGCHIEHFIAAARNETLRQANEY